MENVIFIDEEPDVPPRRLHFIPTEPIKRTSKRSREERYEDAEDDPTPITVQAPRVSAKHGAGKVPMLSEAMTNVLDSYIDTSKMTQPLPHVYDKQWKAISNTIVDKMNNIDDDAMDIDEPPQSEFKKSIMDFKPLKREAKSIKIIDDPIMNVDGDGESAVFTGKKVSNVMTTGGSSASIMSPTLLNEKHHQFAEQASKILNESSMKKLLAVDKSALENNKEANILINLAMEEFKLMFRQNDIKIFNPDHVPSTANESSIINDIPEMVRINLVQFLRAAIFELHERSCVKHDNCVGHKLFLSYNMKTMNNTMAGPQFPSGTQSFPLRELLLPAVMRTIASRLNQGESMSTIMQSIPQGLCLLCTMEVTNNWVISAARKNVPIMAPITLQNFSIVIGTPGEYNSSALLSCGSNNLYGLIAPYPELRLNNYFPYIYSVPIQGNNKKSVLGWAEINDILCEPSVGAKPRGYDGHIPMPEEKPSSSGVPSPSSPFAIFENRHTIKSWRSRFYHDTLHKHTIYNVQANRFTGDTSQTAGATTTKYKERKLSDLEKKNPQLLPFFKQNEWLIGNNAFTESMIPSIRASKPVTGTGTCTMPTTLESLQHHFVDPLSKIVFTDHLRLHQSPENFTAIRNHSEAAAFVLDHKPYWSVSEKTMKPEWIGSPLLEWISFRLNWAYFKRESIRKIYDKQLSNISTGIFVNNTWYNKRQGYDETALNPEGINKIQTEEELHKNTMHSPYTRFFEILQNEMRENDITIMNVTLRSTALPVLTHMYDPYVSRDELSTSMVAAVTDDTSSGGQPKKKFVPNNTVFTHHRFWALYYIHLLERFIESHSDICRAMTYEDDRAYIVKPVAPPLTRTVNTLVKNYKVNTHYHPFDETSATWQWSEVKGHQGSRAILEEKFPNEFIFKYPMVYLYRIMKGKLPTHIIPKVKQDELRVSMKTLALTVQGQWHDHPLLPRDLLHGNTTWNEATRTIPFETPNSHFLWTILSITGRLEQLRRQIESDPSMNENEKDFYLHTIQVRETGMLPITRWILSELLLHEQLKISDDRVTEAIEFFNVDEIDFDGELDMPNFASILHLLNYWYTTTPQSKKNPILEALQKAIPFRSLARVFSDHFFNETKKNVNMITLTILFVMVTSLGLFRRQKGAPPMYRPCFSTMVKIDFALLQTPKQIFNFVNVTKSKILIFMSREILVHAMAQAPHYRDNQIIDWPMMEQHTWSVGNLIRRYLHNYKFWLKAPFNMARRNLEEEIQLKYEKKYDIFLFPKKDFLHTTLQVFHSLHIKHLDKIILLQANLRQLGQEVNNSMNIGNHLQELKEKIQRTQLELTAITYELSNETRSIIWQTLIGKRDNFDIWSLIRQWLHDDDLLLYHRLHEEYLNHTPSKKLELTASQFSLSAFTMIYYLLHIQKQLKQFRLVPIPKEMADNIHQAIRNRRHHLFDTQSMSSTVYHVNITLCCNKVITMHDTNSYGNSYYMYNRDKQYYSCCRKRTKKTGFIGGGAIGETSAVSKKKKETNSNESDEEDDEDEEIEENEDEEEQEEEEESGQADSEEPDPKLWRKIQKRKKKLEEIAEATRKSIEKDQKKRLKDDTKPSLIDQTRLGKNITMDDYPNMIFKERRKIVCRLDVDTKTLVCRNNPPVLTLDLQGYSLQYGSEYSKMITYRHCPKCGDLHTFSLNNYNGGQGYMCANCIQKTWVPSLEMQRTMFCVYCGRQHFKNVHQGLELVTTTDMGDIREPVKLLNYCYADKPKYKHDFVFDKTNSTNRFLILCLDTYLNRHNNMVYTSSMAHFPYQNTVQEDEQGLDIKQNKFSWSSYGKRYNKIPQLVDVWWTPLAAEATL